MISGSMGEGKIKQLFNCLMDVLQNIKQLKCMLYYSMKTQGIKEVCVDANCCPRFLKSVSS